ncbi:hypothetical protein [Streptomyces tsukubensis]|uniref:hypothetical protein n=1 Tax=Streptomyces tsukubensis TaxID=83656 RepID=UPI001E38AF3E|nr:hypothetical protein [Streptomyces tsukubensis]
MVHEVRSLHSIWLWLRRRRDGVGAGDHAAGYNAPQNAMMWSWIGLSVVRVRAERRFPATGGLLGTDGDGSLDLIVGGQTAVAVDLVSPVAYTRPLGRTGTARTTVRFHADDPGALVAALGRAGAGR